MSGFLFPVNFNKNESLNVLMHNLASDPSTPGTGQYYFNTGDKHPYIWDGTAWIDFLNALSLGGNPAAAYALLASPVFSGNPTVPTQTPGNNSLRIANTAFVIAEILARVASLDVLVYKGAIDASSNPNYPAADAGHEYRFSVAGKIGGGSGPKVEIGDMMICHTDSSAGGTHASVGADWDIIQANLDGAVLLDAVQTLTQKTLTSPVINVGSDATGDIYYRTSGGLFARLGIGSTGDLLTVAAGLPSWAAPAAITKFAQDIGDGSTTSIVVTHGIGTRDVIIKVYRKTTPWDEVEMLVEHTSTTTATLTFSVAPTTNQYRVVAV